MSWQPYVDNHLIGSGKVSQAAIYGQDASMLAHSHGFELSDSEIKAIINGFNQIEIISASGVRLQGVKYFTVDANEHSIYGKRGADGCCIVKTKQAVLVTTYQHPIQSSECNFIVEGLAAYLNSVGY